MTLERIARLIDQAAQYRHGLHDLQGLIVHAPFIQVITLARGFNGGRRGVVAFKIET